MNRNTRIRYLATALFGAVSVLFLLFFIYMGLFENVAVYNAGDSHSYMTVTGFSVERLEDRAAPAGIRTVYRRTLNVSGGGESSLCFYLVHHYAQVYYDNELVYSLTADGDNKIGDSVSSNWVAVPIDREDAGKELIIVLTPLFESVTDFEPQFLIGSHFSIIFDQLTRDLPQLFISMLCIFVGVFIVAVELYFALRAKSKAWDMLFMGSFSILLGLWRITDTKSSPLLFSANPMVLGYITIGVLFLCGIPLLLYAGTYFHGKKAALLRCLAAAVSVAAALVLLLQVLGVADFKETLVVSHGMLVVTVCAIAAMALFPRKRAAGDRSRRSWRLLLLPGAGIVIDLAVFYINDSSSDIFFTLVTFILYALITFISSILETTKKAYTDSGTGLTNKVHWNELMNSDAPVEESTVIAMFDLNGLKQVNDTLGHDAGDRMILNFSNILRRTLPKGSVICRWGGDEFAVMLTGIDKEKVEKRMDAVRQAVDDYNTFCEDLPIFYAVGCAFSSEHPDLSRMELMNEADRQMYLNKRKWYSEGRNAARG